MRAHSHNHCGICGCLQQQAMRRTTALLSPTLLRGPDTGHVGDNSRLCCHRCSARAFRVLIVVLHCHDCCTTIGALYTRFGPLTTAPPSPGEQHAPAASASKHVSISSCTNERILTVARSKCSEGPACQRQDRFRVTRRDEGSCRSLQLPGSTFSEVLYCGMRSARQSWSGRELKCSCCVRVTVTQKLLCFGPTRQETRHRAD